MKGILALAASLAVYGVYGVTVSVVAPQPGAAKSVTVANKPSAEFDAGAAAALKATANAGYAFAGWYLSYDDATGEFSGEAPLADSADWRSASAKYVVGGEDVTIYARFAEPAEDSLEFDLAEAFAPAVETFDDSDRPVIPLTNALDLSVQVYSLSTPAVTVSGLPGGLRFDKTSLRIIGKPAAPGVYSVTASAKNPSGFAFSQVYCVRVANATSAHVEGIDSADLSVGEEVDEYLETFFYIVNTNSALKAVEVTGLPPGLALEKDPDYDDYYYVTGVATAAGDYTVWCKAKFEDGTVESASALVSVAGPSPFDYEGNVDFDGLAEKQVGDSISAADGVVIGEYYGDTKLGVVGVSGLPTGIKAVKKPLDDGTVQYVLAGTFTKAGRFKVSVSVAYEDWESDKIANVSLAQDVVVADTPGVYLSASVLDPDGMPKCAVKGAGVYSAGSTAKLTATAGAGYVFAGWCDSAGGPMAVPGEDFRKSPASVAIGGGTELEWFADFIPKDEDYIDISALSDAEMLIDTAGTDVVDLPFLVDSGSLPTIKFSGLPSGVTCAPSPDIAGEYVLAYDPSAVKRPPYPGRYKVVATGTNASRCSDTATFLVTVANYGDDDIHVEDDYGVLAPDAAMAPISLSNAVDFVRGDTLKVSGLPAGVKYDDKSAPRMLSGTPTKPGSYTLTFTAKIVDAGGTRDAVATAFITVKDYPTVAAVIDDAAAAAGNKVAGAGSFPTGKKTTLKATAAKGWVFAGWGEGSGLSGLAALNPSLAYVSGTADLTEIEASFIEVRDDGLFIDDPGVVVVAKGVEVSTNLVSLITSSRSLPAITVKGLPGGLNYNSGAFLITGSVKATEKAGYRYVTLTAKNAGGYTYTRILKFVVLDSPGDPVPGEEELVNDANIDFSALDELYTGDFCPADGVSALSLAVDPADDVAVSAVKVSGLPAGLKSAETIEDGAAEIVVYGTPTKADRYTVKVDVTYADRSRATSQYAFIVQDGGCAWLDVGALDPALGSATGSGVYASGAQVKLGAKAAGGYVFAGWYEDEAVPFAAIAEMDGVDCRTASAAFVFRPAMFENDPPVLFADFVAKADDAVSIEGLSDGWEIEPSEDGVLEFAVNSASLPKITVSGLPKGVSLDAVGSKLVYSSDEQAKIAPGFYTVTVKAVNQSNASAAEKLSVFVANKTSDAIDGLNPSADAYPLYAGVALDPGLIMPEIDVTNGWKLAAAGLPSGLKLVQDKDTKAYSVQGVAAKAGTNTVTFTATKGKEKEVATITVAVAALPEWAFGTYDGGYFAFDDGETNAVGQVTATVSSAGKVSGKVLVGGKSYSFSANSYDSFDGAASNFVAEVAVPWSASNKETFLLFVGDRGDGLGQALMEPVGNGAHFAEFTQNSWLRKDVYTPPFATGAKQPVLALGSGLTCKFGANGAVTVSGKLDGTSVNGKAQTLVDGLAEGSVTGRFVVYAAGGGFEGGAYCEVVGVVLSDADGDGKLDTAAAMP